MSPSCPGDHPPTQPALIVHPPWCVEAQCVTTVSANGYVDTAHCSAATVVTIDDELWKGMITRVVDHTYPDEPGGVHLKVFVTNDAWPDAKALHTIPLEQVPTLAAWLMGLHNTAILAAARPVVAP